MREGLYEGSEPHHGKYSTYTLRGCRCDECRRANREHQRVYLESHPEQKRKSRVREYMRRQGIA